MTYLLLRTVMKTGVYLYLRYSTVCNRITTYRYIDVMALLGLVYCAPTTLELQISKNNKFIFEKKYTYKMNNCASLLKSMIYTANIRGHQGAQGAQHPPLKTQNRAPPPPKRSAHPSRVRRGCFDPPPPKIEAVGGANPHPP